MYSIAYSTHPGKTTALIHFTFIFVSFLLQQSVFNDVVKQIELIQVSNAEILRLSMTIFMMVFLFPCSGDKTSNQIKVGTNESLLLFVLAKIRTSRDY